MDNPSPAPLSLAEVDALMEEHFPSGFPGIKHGPNPFGTQPQVIETFPLDESHVEAARDFVASGAVLGRTSTNSNIKHIRHTHHRLAQLLAGGMEEGRAARLCNYSPSRVSILKADPAFIELMSFYKSQVDEEFADFIRTAADLSMDFLQHLQQQLDEAPEKFTPALALEAIRTLADRSGHAPVSKSISVAATIDMGSQLKAARERAQAAYIDQAKEA